MDNSANFKSVNISVNRNDAFDVGKCIMFSAGEFKLWDTSVPSNDKRFCGVVIYKDIYDIQVAYKGVFPTDLMDGIYYCDNTGTLTTVFPSGAFMHEVGSVSNGWFKVNDAVVGDSSTLLDTASTGYISGGNATINGGNPLAFDITPLTAQIADNTIADAVVFTAITTTTKTELVITNTGISYLYVDDNSNTIKQTIQAPTNTRNRTRVYLYRVSESGGVISGFSRIATPVQQVSNQLRALYTALGVFRDGSGSAVTSDTAARTFTVTSGMLIDYGVNEDHLDPHEGSITIFNSSTDTFRYATTTGTIAVDANLINAKYQVAGVPTDIPGSSNRYGIYYVFIFLGVPNYRVVYGGDYYQFRSDAEDALSAEAARALAPSVYSEAFLLGAVLSEKGATDFTDLSKTEFITTNKFGLFAGGISSGGLVTKTSELINDGETGVAKYQEVSPLFSIYVNFIDVTSFAYVAPVNFKINTIDNPDAITYTITKNAVPYVLGTSIAQYDDILITPLAVGFLALKSETL